MKIPTIVPVSDLRQDVASVLQKLKESPDPLIVTQRGRAVAVLQGIEAYEKEQHDLELLRQLLRGDEEIAAGVGRSLEDVMRDARAKLESAPE